MTTERYYQTDVFEQKGGLLLLCTLDGRRPLYACEAALELGL